MTLPSARTILISCSREVPTLVANQKKPLPAKLPRGVRHAGQSRLRELKLHTALAALTAWGIADRTEPLASASPAASSTFW